MSQLKRAVFLDRDGVVIEESHYVASPDGVQLLPGSAEAIAELNRAGWSVIVVSNQSGVARGFFPIESVTLVNNHLAKLLRGSGARLDGIFFCPHHPMGQVARYSLECECRKPKPGMLLQAARELGLDLSASWMIGDRVSDLEAGAAAGCRTVLVRTGYGRLVNPTDLDREALNLELIAVDLAEAVRRISPKKDRRD